MVYTDSTDSSFDNNNNIEYATFDKLKRRKIQPSGHNKVFFLPNPKITPEQYKIFTNAKIILDAATNVPSIQMIRFEDSSFILNDLRDEIVINNETSWCRGISPYYINTKLYENNGILFITKNKLNNQNNETNLALLAFATIRLLNDNRYNRKNYLEVDIICANPGYKNLGTKLLNAIFDLAKKADCKYIHLEAVDDIIDFYKKYGFVEDKGPLVRKEKGLTLMEYRIIPEEEYKTSQKYKENYENIEAFGGKRKLGKSYKKKKSGKKKTYKKRRIIKK